MLCAGTMRRPGWKTVDANERTKPDYLAWIPPLPEAVTSQKWDEVEWIHGITSVYPWEAERLLVEVKSILVPDGKLVLEQPDFSKADRLEWIFGDPRPHDPLHMNRWAYTPESLTMLLDRAGFSRIEVLPAKHHFPARDFRIECSR